MILVLCGTAFSHADIVFLSALDLQKAEQGYGQPRANLACSGQPLSIGGKRFAKGFGTHAVSDLYVDIKGAATRFSAWVGVDDGGGGQGNIEFFVYGDGKTLWRSGIVKGGEAARAVDVNLAGVKTLRLHVAADDIGRAHVDWADAQIEYTVKRPETIPCPAPPIVELPENWKRSMPLNGEWRFLRLDKPDAADAQFERETYDDSRWESVSLPHTPRIERRDERYPFQGICWYRRALAADPAWKEKRVYLKFPAAMQIAEVWINGTRKLRHLGGYLPFTVDLSADLHYDRPNSIAVRLDNRDTQECPPGTPTSGLDFTYPGGLYRGAELIVTSPVHISDPVAAGIEAGGGIFVQYKDVSPAKATVAIQTHVLNPGPHFQRQSKVVSRLLDPDGKEVGSDDGIPIMLAGAFGHQFHQEIIVASPKLWHPDHPWLYTLVSQVRVGNIVTDEVRTRVGIRTFSLGNRFAINGQEFHICGSNRHQEYPYIEYAMSPRAAYRDAKKIKDGGFNFIRMCHYPQDPAFLDACDELGILLQAPTPGWQYFSFTDSFVRQTFQDIRDLVRRDRNHASIVFWEPNLNETDAKHADWQRAAHEVCHAELPGDQCFSFGDPYPPKPGWHWDVQGFAREYGDFNFGGNESTSRHLRGEGEAAMLQQAWNYQWTLNDMQKQYANPHSQFIGCATWVMFDYNRGYYHKPCTCGMMDIMRLPKFVYYFYQSQRDPRLLQQGVESGPMIFVANYWTPRPSPCKVVVYSNCDAVELRLNGKLIRRQQPDSGPDCGYGSETSFDGGNARHLVHPPFTFADVPYEPGTLTAVGYLDSKEVVRQEVSTPGKPVALRLTFDTSSRDLASDGADAIFVRAIVIDAAGRIVPDSSAAIAYSVEGPARLIGANPFAAEAGIASILLQAGSQAGKIIVTARSPGLAPATAVVESKLP